MTNPASQSRSVGGVPSRWRQIYQLLKVRLRFVVVLVVMAVVIGQWETLSTHVNRWLDRAASRLSGQGTGSVSVDTEYFCPMCPGVLSGWPDTCPVCNMPLVRRRKGEAVLLPSGVVARMQFSTQRVQLAGLQTSAVAYHPLAYRWETIGRVVDTRAQKPSSATRPSETSANDDGDPPASVFHLETLVAATEVSHLEGAEHVDVWLEPRTGVAPRKARVIASRPAPRTPGFVTLQLVAQVGGGEVAEATNSDAAKSEANEIVAAESVKYAPVTAESLTTKSVAKRWPVGALVRLEFVIPAATTAPFRDQPRGLPDVLAGEPRSAYLCPDHLEHVHDKAGKCPLDAKPLVAVKLAENQRIRWRCGVHADVLGVGPDVTCDRCPGRPLVASIVTFAPPGEVLAIPSTAVIDTGRETVVYLETGPGMFDGVKVRLGPRCDDDFPVIEGLTAGQRVVTRGTFLVDAEARLNPSLASAYFGASGSEAASSSPASPVPLAATTVPSSVSASGDKTVESVRKAVDPRVVRRLLAKFDMPSADRELAIRQGTCPVTDEPLGSMGKPPKKMVDGQPVFVCCEGCAGSLAKAVRRRQAKSAPPSKAPIEPPSQPQVQSAPTSP